MMHSEIGTQSVPTPGSLRPPVEPVVTVPDADGLASSKRDPQRSRGDARPALPDAERQRLNATVRAAQALARVVGMRLTYERDNEILQQATAQLLELVAEHVERHGGLRWRIEPKMIRPDGEGIAADSGAETPIAGRLYRDGVRALVLESGIQSAEVIGLAEVLAGSLRYGGQSDDLVTVLWKRDLRHVDYFLLDHSDLIDLDSMDAKSEAPLGGRDRAPGGEGGGTSNRHLLRDVYAEVWRVVSMPEWSADGPEHVMDVDSRPRSFEPPDRDDPSRGEVSAKSESERFLETDEAPVGDVWEKRDVGALFGIGSAEVERLGKEIEELGFVQSLARASDLALNLIRAGQIEVDAQSLAALYVDAIREHAFHGHLERALGLLTRLSQLSADPSTPARARASFGEVQVCLARPDRLAPFCDMLIRSPATSSRIVLAYLDLLGAAGLAGAEHVLKVVEPPQLRARLVRFLSDRALDGRFPVEEVLKSAHGDVVEAVLLKLRERHGNSLDYFVPLLGHPNAVVRRYIAQCLGSIRNERSAILCERLLDDAVPEVRIAALEALAQLEHKPMYKRLLPRVHDAGLLKVPTEEQTALFRALMSSDQSRAVRALEGIALRRGWPWNRPQERLRELATCTLAKAGTHRARTFLKRGMRSRDLGLRQACERAMPLVPPCTVAGRLGEALVNDGCLTDNGLCEALHHQKRHGGRLGEIVVRNGLAEERAVLRVMAQRFGLIGCLTASDLDHAVIESAAFHFVPVETAKRHRVIPVHYSAATEQLFLATANPGDGSRFEAVRQEIHVREIVVLIALKPTIDAAILQFYGGNWGAIRSAASAWARVSRAGRRDGKGVLSSLARWLLRRRGGAPVMSTVGGGRP